VSCVPVYLEYLLRCAKIIHVYVCVRACAWCVPVYMCSLEEQVAKSANVVREQQVGSPFMTLFWLALLQCVLQRVLQCVAM